MKVKSITEAFSMQPCTLRVGDYYNETEGVRIASIDLEVINIPVNGDPYDYKYYVGRDKNGNKLFQYKAEAVNVHFETQKTNHANTNSI